MKHMKKAVGLTIGLALATLLGCNLKKLPSCDAPDVQRSVKEALSTSTAFRGRPPAYFLLGIPGETRYRSNPPKRVCRATLTTPSTGTSTLFYSVEWHDKAKGIFWVQTMGSRDDGT